MRIIDQFDRVPLNDVANNVSIMCIMMFPKSYMHVCITYLMNQGDDVDDDRNMPADKPRRWSRRHISLEM